MKAALSRLSRFHGYLKPNTRLFQTSSPIMAALTIDSKVRMNSGHEIPVLGFGVYQIPSSITSDSVYHALQTGYRHVDSAVLYRNEAPSAAGMKKSGIPR